MLSCNRYLPRDSNGNALYITTIGNVFVGRWVIPLVSIPLLAVVTIQLNSFWENFIVIVKVFWKTFLYHSNVLKFSSNQANLSFFGGKILSGEQITFPFIFSSRLSQHEAQVEKIWTLNSFQKTPELLR